MKNISSDVQLYHKNFDKTIKSSIAHLILCLDISILLDSSIFNNFSLIHWKTLDLED